MFFLPSTPSNGGWAGLTTLLEQPSMVMPWTCCNRGRVARAGGTKAGLPNRFQTTPLVRTAHDKEKAKPALGHSWWVNLVSCECHGTLS